MYMKIMGIALTFCEWLEIQKAEPPLFVPVNVTVSRSCRVLCHIAGDPCDVLFKSQVGDYQDRYWLDCKVRGLVVLDRKNVEKVYI